MFDGLIDFFGNPTYLTFFILLGARILVSILVLLLIAVGAGMRSTLGGLLVAVGIITGIATNIVFIIGTLYSIYSIFTSGVNSFSDFLLMVLFILILFYQAKMKTSKK